MNDLFTNTDGNSLSCDCLPYYIIPIKELILNDHVGEWCQLPYPGHKKGCPNYNKSDRCPPKAPHVSDYFDLKKPLYFVHSEFDLNSHSAKMKEKYPEWSDRQCRCLLYWQGTSRKQMKERAAWAVQLLNTDLPEVIKMTNCPEGMGVNVFATAFKNGLAMDKTKSIKTARHITLMGYKK